MKSKVKQRLNVDQRKQAMLMAARELFLAKGYAATNLDEVVAKSGGSLTTLYQIFGNKEGLWRELVLTYGTRVTAPLEDEHLSDGPPRTVLRDFAVGSAVRFLPLDADAVALMTSGTSNYVAVTMPAHTYPGQARPVATVGVAALLVSSATVTAEEVDTLMQRTFSGVDFMDRGSLLGGMIKRSTAQRGTTLPLHSGAEAFYGGAAGPK